MYFQNYLQRKTCLHYCLKTPVWEFPSTGGMVHMPKHWFNLNASAFTILIDHYEGNWVGKYFLVSWKVLRLFVNRLTADDKYSLLSGENSMQRIRIHLSRKQNIFSEFVSAFFKSTLNFEHFLKKRTLISYVFPKLPPPKDVLT